jgi:hypothetical protein
MFSDLIAALRFAMREYRRLRWVRRHRINVTLPF